MGNPIQNEAEMEELKYENFLRFDRSRRNERPKQVSLSKIQIRRSA